MSSSKQHRTRQQSGQTGREGTEFPLQIAMTMAESRQRLQSRLIDAADTALEENSEYCKSVLEKMAGSSDLVAQWAALCHHKVKRYSDLTLASIEILSESWLDTNRLISEALATVGAGIQIIGPQSEEVFTERRVSARIIPFPDRRIQSLMAQAAAGSSARQQAAQKRSAA